MEKSTGLLTVAILLLAVSLGMVSIGLATEHWLDIVVDRASIEAEATNGSAVTTALTTDAAYYSRYRGLIRTCFPGSDLFCESSGHFDSVVCPVRNFNGNTFVYQEVEVTYINFTPIVLIQ